MCFKQLLILAIGLLQIQRFAQINDKILWLNERPALFKSNILPKPIINFHISTATYYKSNKKIVLC